MRLKLAANRWLRKRRTAAARSYCSAIAEWATSGPLAIGAWSAPGSRRRGCGRPRSLAQSVVVTGPVHAPRARLGTSMTREKKGGSKELGERIAALRASRRTADGEPVTQRVLGGAVGVDQMAVSRWENGVHMPDSDNLRAIAEFFEIPMEELLDGPRSNVLPIRPNHRELPVIREVLAMWPPGVPQPDDDDLAAFVNYAKFHRMTAVGLLTSLLTLRNGMTPEQQRESARATEAHRDPEVPPRAPRRAR